MRSDSKLGGYRGGGSYNRGYQNSYVTNRSNVSAHSDNLRRILEERYEMFPSGFAQLLKYQQRNIKQFKAQISREKQKINDDMNAFKTQLIHTLQDLRLSLHAQLDRIYQNYIERYAKFKGQILQINRLKDQIEIQCGGSLSINTKSNFNSRQPINSTTISNNQTISQMQNANKQLKKYHYLNYIAQLQKQRVLPLTDLQRQIVILNQYSNGFYQPKQFQQILANLRGYIHSEIHRVYQNNHLYIREVDAILFKQQPRILDEVMYQPPPPPMIPVAQTVPLVPLVPVVPVMPVVPNYERRQYLPVPNLPQRQQSSFYGNMPSNMTKSNGRILNPHTDRVGTAGDQSNIGNPLFGQISSSQQALKVDWVQKINLVNNSKIEPPGSQICLCGIGINNQILAFGMKDGTIQIMSYDGQLIRSLKQHKSSICTLSVIKNKGQIFLASGSDIGCSKIVIWDTNSWRNVQMFENHKAAVTAIIDLQDNSHILSGSYDKKINIYNIQQGKFVYNLPANQSSVTGAIINKNGTKVVTCGLDKALNVWQISKSNGKVQTLFLQRKIQNDVLICSIVASAWQNQLVIVGTKDGKIKMINIQKGESYKTINCSENYLIEMILVQRQSKPYYPIIIAWPYKQNKLFIVNSESSLIATKNINSYLQFGCGVSPKSFFFQRGGIIYSVSHNQSSKEITQFRLQQLK